MKTGFIAAAMVVTTSYAGAAATQQATKQPAEPSRTIALPDPAHPQKTTPSAADSHANPTAAALADFKRRIDDYLASRGKARKAAPSLKETSDPAKIKAAEEGLAAAIRAERAAAQPGDVFTPEIQVVFRGLLAPELKGKDGEDAKKVIKDDAPKGGVPLQVNAKYPEGAPLPTVPSKLLRSLPMLPKEVEYRIVGRSLILRDTGADIIVDFIPNAIK